MTKYGTHLVQGNTFTLPSHNGNVVINPYGEITTIITLPDNKNYIEYSGTIVIEKKLKKPMKYGKIYLNRIYPGTDSYTGNSVRFLPVALDSTAFTNCGVGEIYEAINSVLCRTDISFKVDETFEAHKTANGELWSLANVHVGGLTELIYFRLIARK